MSKKSSKTIEEEEIEQEHKYRLFSIVLYEDTTSYNFEETLRLLKSMGQYAYIKHSPEKDEKKEHIHFVLRLVNQKKIERISELTGIPIQHIKRVKSERMMLRYLIHLDDQNKLQYDYHNVICSANYQRTFRKSLNDLETEEQIINNIYQFINNIYKKEHSRSGILFYLIQYVNSNCYETIYKRYRQEFNLYLNDLIN